jgi:hypothetical protein
VVINPADRCFGSVELLKAWLTSPARLVILAMRLRQVLYEGRQHGAGGLSTDVLTLTFSFP